MARIIAALLVLFIASYSTTWADDATPKWIWTDEVADGQSAYFRMEFILAGPVKSAIFAGTCDNKFAGFINGEQKLRNENWGIIVVADVADSLREGANLLAMRGRNDAGQAGVFCRLSIELENGETIVVTTNDQWKASAKSTRNWNKNDYDDTAWSKPRVIGSVGGDVAWSSTITMSVLDQAESVDPSPSPKATAVTNLNLLPGFRAELVYTVPKTTQGSWVSMANAPDGGLYVSDQDEAGLFHVKPAVLGDPESETVVTPVPANISSAQGLFWAFDSLYVHVNQGRKSGLYRVFDSDDSGDLDAVDRLMKIDGGGEHGPHAIIYTEDKQNLYINAGNHTHLPEISGSRAPTNWAEDHILPRLWDANGHAKGRLAPGGWICKVTPDGQSWEVVSNGYRNEYDIALNTQGELFAFDADMEYDLGSPWYRPTRLCHAVSGSEFGWRSGTGKWPAYYEDSIPPVVNIGPGSPTGIVFGKGAKFPPKYQRALFMMDWTFGTIYAVHMTPKGASYTGEKEEFVSGSPLGVTDTVIGSDGAFYFAVGGRGTQSALYRVYYDGPESTDEETYTESDETRDARALRRRLEAFHGAPNKDALNVAWPYLGHDDRFIRFAARIAVESQPVAQWQDKALNEKDPLAATLALIALSRQGDAELQGDVLASLSRIDLAETDHTTTLAALRAYELCFARMGKPTSNDTDSVIAKLDPLLPATNDDVNSELVRILVYLDAPSIIDKTLALMADARPTEIPKWAELIKRNKGYGGTIERMLENHPPTRKIGYAFMLRNVRYGWSMDQREAYFTFINEASKHRAGASYVGFLTTIRADALANCSEAEKFALAEITGQNLNPLPDFKIVDTIGNDKPWTLADAINLVSDQGLSKRNFEKGRNAFYAVGCVKCHRFDGAGGGIGPDLSSVRNKFSMNDLLEAIIDPNKVISDQYGSSMVTLHDGEMIVGIVVNNSGSREVGEMEIYTSDPHAEPITVKTADVDTIEPWVISQMPEGLADALNDEELLDLLAYLQSRGNPEDRVFN